MDSLLEKLRAAAPQARGQRDRRRRARLKEKHQVRVASGQKLPDAPFVENPENGEDGDETKDGEPAETDSLNAQTGDSEANAASKEPQASEGEDIADRAASMLKGLRNSTEDDDRARRRRESADEERRNRRLRRRNGAGSGSKDIRTSVKSSGGEPMSPTTQAESTEPEEPSAPSPHAEDDNSSRAPSMPSIIVSPTADQHDSNRESADADGSPPQKPVEPSE